MNETMTKPRTRVTWSVEDRAAWLELFTKSGQTAAEFCRDNDLPQATLSFWLRQSQEVPVEPGELVEVALPVPVTAADRISSGTRRTAATARLSSRPSTTPSDTATTCW